MKCFLLFLLVLFTPYPNKVYSQHNESRENIEHKTETNSNLHSQLNDSAATSPAPPVIERIEIRLVDTENNTTAADDTPLIIVDVVKKNGSTGVAATIQQSILSENPTLNEQVGTAKPDQSFLLRLHQPNYQAVSYIPFETTTTTNLTTTTLATTTTPQQPTNSVAEEEEGDNHSIISTTEMPPNIGQTEVEGTRATFEKQKENWMAQAGRQSDDQIRQQNGQFDDKNYSDTMSLMRQHHPPQQEEMDLMPPADEQNEDADGVDDADEAIRVEDDEDEGDVHGRDEFLVNEAAILGETHHQNFSTLNWQNYHNFSDSIAQLHSNRNFSEMFIQSSSSTNVNGQERALADQQWNHKKQQLDNNDDPQHQNKNGAAADQHQTQQGQTEDEECLANRAKLSRETVHKLRTERRRIVHSIRRINRQQRELCRPDPRQNHVQYRKCPMWRREKFFLYYAFMRITYCSNHERWPSAKMKV